MPFVGNFSHEKIGCALPGMKENESHITSGSCQIYGDIWNDRGDLRNAEDLVKLFSAVLERRSLLNRLEEEEREAPSPGSGDSNC